MTTGELKRALAAAVQAARRTGLLMRRNLGFAKKIVARSRHDIKLELDVRCQRIIETILLGAFPESELLGEEGMAGAAGASLRWVVDPIDGTVNFTYGVPHACVSIALQERGERLPRTFDAPCAHEPPRVSSPSPPHTCGGEGRGEEDSSQFMERPGDYSTSLGVVYDPFCDELWTAARGAPARLNGKIIHVSRRKDLALAMVAIGFAKDAESLRENLPVFNVLVRRALKIRMTGSAALALAYVACGRFDAYLESGIWIWDIAAGGFILERAGGDFWRRPIAGRHKYRMLADNGWLRRKVQRAAREARRGIADCGLRIAD
jgi:myo-inositol-1(or 4)-monophosphatase